MDDDTAANDDDLNRRGVIIASGKRPPVQVIRASRRQSLVD